MSAIACERIGVRTEATAGHAASGKRGRERDCTSRREGWVRDRVSRKSRLLAIGSELGVVVCWRPRGVLVFVVCWGSLDVACGSVGGGGCILPLWLASHFADV